MPGTEKPLTPELVTLHEGLRSRGIPIAEACKLAGHGVGVFYTWKEKAEAGENGVYAEFAKRVLPHSKRGNLAVLEPPSHDWRRIDYFQDWASRLVLDSGEEWEPEQWQLDPVEDLLSDDFQAVWLVVGEGNGKTTLTAAVVLYLLEHQLTPEIPIGSATVTQAETLFRQIEGFIVRSNKLSQFNLAPGVRRIDCRRTRGHTRVYPHNERSGDGVIPSGWVLDEGHLHPDLRLYRTWKGKYRKRRGPGFLISTAGEPQSEFEELRSKLLREADEKHQEGPYIRAVVGNTVIHDWAVRDRKDAKNFEVVAEANPLSLVTAAELEEKHAEPEMTDAHWLRRTCNIAAREADQGVTPEAWDALKATIEVNEKARKYAFLDVAYDIDTTAMGVLAWESHERRVVRAVHIIEPPVDEEDIVSGLLDLWVEEKPEAIVFDPSRGAQQMAQMLEKGTHPLQVERGIGPLEFVFWPQTNPLLSLAAVRLDEAIRAGWLVHDGDPKLRQHVLNAVKKSVGYEKWRYDRPHDKQGGQRGKYPIDALSGLLMAHSHAVEESNQPTRGGTHFF